MRKLHTLLFITALLFFTQQSFADLMNSDKESRPCLNIVKACLAGGYTREATGPNKNFWLNCMKPALLGKSVSGVNFSKHDVKTCRQVKIEQLKQELGQLRNAMGR